MHSWVGVQDSMYYVHDFAGSQNLVMHVPNHSEGFNLYKYLNAF